MANKKSKAKDTIEVIQAVGAMPGSSGNFRHAARFLGSENLADIHVLAQVLNLWQSTVRQIVKKKLVEKKVL